MLDIAEFHVAAGEQMVLVGRSGCGKTTLLHVIAGISRPDCGKVRINDWDITLMPEAECDRFRRGTDRLRLPDLQPAARLLGLGKRAAGHAVRPGRQLDRSRALQLLDRVGLGHRMTHKPAQLSVGEQQRVAVARALANAPAAAGRRADRQRRFRPSSSRSSTSCARPAGRTCADYGDALARSGPAVPRVDQLEEFSLVVGQYQRRVNDEARMTNDERSTKSKISN